MKTNEFKVKIEALGFLVYETGSYLEIKDADGKYLADILKEKRWVYDCEFEGFESLHEVKQTELMEVVTEYVTTQVKDREEEKKYLVRFPNIKRATLSVVLTKVNWEGGGYSTVDWPCESFIVNHPEQFFFTEKEIKDIDERYFLFAEEVKK